MSSLQTAVSKGPTVAAHLKLIPPQVPCAYELDTKTRTHFLRVGSLNPTSDFYLLFYIFDDDISLNPTSFKKISGAPVINGSALKEKEFSVPSLAEFFAEIREATIKVFDKAQINSILEALAQKQWGHVVEAPVETMINKLLWLINGDIDA